MFDDYTVDIDARARDSFNSTTTNTTNLAADVTNVGNVDDSVNNSGNDTTDITDSFLVGSGNLDVEMDHVGNTDSYNDTTTITDESFTDNSDNSINDDSVNAGVREYNTGFGDLAGVVAGGGGDLLIDNRSTILDQSVNQNIVAGGVDQFVANDALVASGDGATVAGGDYTPTYNLDSSTTIVADGDVLLDSVKEVNFAYNSGNSTTIDVDITDASQEWDIEDSGNTFSHTVDIQNSFNDDVLVDSSTTWDIDADVIWDSGLAAIVDDVEVDLDF